MATFCHFTLTTSSFLHMIFDFKGEVGAPLNRFKPSSKLFYWPFQGGTSFVDLLCFVLSCVCYVFARVCLIVLCGHLLGKGWPLGSRFWCLTVSLSLSHWYPGSGVVLDCIDSWSLHPYLLSICLIATEKNVKGILMAVPCERPWLKTKCQPWIYVLIYRNFNIKFTISINIMSFDSKWLRNQLSNIIPIKMHLDTLTLS